MGRLIYLLIVCGVMLATLAPINVAANTYVVNSIADEPDADSADGVCAGPSGGCTLRAAVMEANAHPGADFILVPAGTYVLTRVGIDANASRGDLDITEDLTILGIGGPVIIDANGGNTFDRAFEVISGSLTLQDLTIQNGNTTGHGGAIYAQGNLFLTNVSIINNTAALSGGGIYSTGSIIQIASSQIKGNKAQGSGGGGISLEYIGVSFPQLTISGSSFVGNQASGILSTGGGLLMYGVTGVIQNSTFRNNTAQGDGGGLAYIGTYIGLTLNVTDSLFDGNTAAGRGGGLYLYGQTTIHASQVVNNSAPEAGGIYAFYGTHSLDQVQVSYNTATGQYCGGIELDNGNLDLNRGQVDHNTAIQWGGGLCAGGSGTIHLSITDTNIFENSAAQGGGIWTSIEFIAQTSAIYNNYALTGGGIYATGLTTLKNTTISGNRAGENGGGIFADTTATISMNSVTLAGNWARTGFPASGNGGGIFVASPATANAADTLIALNSNSLIAIAYSDCFGALNSGGYNFISSSNGCTITGDPTGNQVGGTGLSRINPLLGPLQNNGGYTLTQELLTGSPAIDAGNNAVCPATDQRGIARPYDGKGSGTPICDIGAYEVAAHISQTLQFGPIANKLRTDSPFMVTATASSGLPVDFSSNTPSICSATSAPLVAGVSSAMVILSSAGICTLVGQQPGNSTFDPALAVTQTFGVTADLFLPLIFK